MEWNKIKRIAVMTGGGDCPGLNAVIRAVTKSAINRYGLEVWGVEDGYRGLIEDRIGLLNYNDVSNILTLGGTILGSCNSSNPFSFPVRRGQRTIHKDVSDTCIANLRKRGIEALVCIGGDGTMASAAAFAKKGLPIIGVPKTIDNDIWGTDITFGFNTAVTTAAEAIDKVHTTASSHHRVMIVEVMGRYAGWIALHAGVAGGSDVILIPEIPYQLEKIAQYVLARSKKGKRFSIITVAEGAKPKGGKAVVFKTIKDSPDPVRLGGISFVLAEQLGELTGLSCRAVNLGHIQRGGSPTPFDRVLATNFGHYALELLMKGQINQLVVWTEGRLGSVPLARIAGKIKTVRPNDPLIAAAKAVGTSFGV
ncbi:MAG TPA: ATP-dependent 6-phosphofructokinase [Anaerohalosphaeraceae bacterium]|nr:6-phosphofructokinase [Phycisphaerae bacterium]HOK95304.1 ATP-dependent 6-phosphofructokinase [Anaerohalosphaeraceae bacterium]HOL30374.1 ATP-dependent 6-phosphofructokinase [Anaerohalosphaeraceae bacterium]HOM75632.1 ATP-dependent 6-phosphofructokinase [Anaerohalosphaeraceae bacterium]HPC63072.1 ATP-dependent 6-phosphofructokinase [Anaerohalosphaeraceae bacterium]